MNKLLLLLVVGIWIGLVLGISFIEAPLKFQAPGITLKLGLGIGKLVFGALNKIELLFSFILAIASFQLWKSFDKITSIGIGVLLGIVLIQSFFLLPILDERIEVIQAGLVPEPANYHIGYIILEVLKLGGLIFLFIKIYRSEQKTILR